ncbi:hypothetical protein CbC4_4008 (plasmid) [Clostridium botulinum BKT015925]|nr:hypothetical protein CbC4_4008 [Clostridium botulinum BKT015925]
MDIVGNEVGEAVNPKAMREAYDFSRGRFTKRKNILNKL